MMSKRTGFQFRQPRAKMPKLDITISSSQLAPVPGPSTSRPNQIVMTSSSKPSPESMDMWGDDDDELIMLASQAAEKVEANAQQVLSQSMSIHDISYGKFRREVDASTQIKRPFENDALMEEFMFLNDDEDVFSKLPDFTEAPPKNPSPETNEFDLFADPFKNINNKITNKENAKQPVDAVDASFRDMQKKAEKAKAEAQTTFLSNKLRDQKKEIENLKESLTKINDKCQTKEGEASTLRYELELNRHQYDKLRKDKLAEIQNLEKEYLEKVANLEKTVEAQKSEIDFKNMEMLNKRSRKSLNDSLASQSVTFRDVNFGEQSLNIAESFALFKLNSTGLRSQPDTIPSKLDLMNMHISEMNQPLNNKDANLLKQLQFFQMTLHQLHHLKQCQSDDKLIKQIFNFAADLVISLRNYTENLELHNFSEYNPALEYKALSESSRLKSNTFEKWSSVQEAPIVAGERLIFERRILSVIAVLCYYCDNITKLLLTTPIPVEADAQDAIDDVSMASETFSSLLIDVLTTIGFSKNLDVHCGFINAAANYLSAIAENYIPSEEKNTVILNLFKAIVFCQPDIFSLEKLTEFLETVSKQSANDLINTICHNRNNKVHTYAVYNIRRYSPDTCPLQVYADLLETAFPQYEKLPDDKSSAIKLKTLTETTIKLMTFLRNCFKRPVPWLFRQIENGSENGPICHCYCHIVSCIIVLLHLCIKYWIDNPHNFDIKKIKIIFQMAAIFLYDNFSQHYESKVLQLGDVFIKNRLQVIYDWIAYYQHLFKLGSSHHNAIKSVNLRRVMLMNEPQRVSTQLQQQNSQPQNENLDQILNESFQAFF